MAKHQVKTLEAHGYCSKTGVCVNPFGIKPEWVQKLAERIRVQHILTNAEEAPF